MGVHGVHPLRRRAKVFSAAVTSFAGTAANARSHLGNAREVVMVPPQAAPDFERVLAILTDRV
jgi:hypothetical protein